MSADLRTSKKEVVSPADQDEVPALYERLAATLAKKERLIRGMQKCHQIDIQAAMRFLKSMRKSRMITPKSARQSVPGDGSNFDAMGFFAQQLNITSKNLNIFSVGLEQESHCRIHNCITLWRASKEVAVKVSKSKELRVAASPVKTLEPGHEDSRWKDRIDLHSHFISYSYSILAGFLYDRDPDSGACTFTLLSDPSSNLYVIEMPFDKFYLHAPKFLFTPKIDLYHGISGGGEFFHPRVMDVASHGRPRNIQSQVRPGNVNQKRKFFNTVAAILAHYGSVKIRRDGKGSASRTTRDDQVRLANMIHRQQYPFDFRHYSTK